VWAKAMTDTNLITKDLRQRSEQAREREIFKEADCDAGGFNVPLLLALKANTQLEVGIGWKVSFLYEWRRTVVTPNVQRLQLSLIQQKSVTRFKKMSDVLSFKGRRDGI
jgi:hypothetical protein